MLQQMTEIDWESLVEFIQQEKCAIFLGPQLSINALQADRQEAFLREFYLENQDLIASYHQRDGLLIFKSRSIKNRLLSRIKRFYEQDFGNPMLQQLAQIPFHLLVSTTPDLSLSRCFEQQGFAFDFNYYNKNRERRIEQIPTAQRPLVYNLFGCVDDWDTLLVSHADIFDYIKQSYTNHYLQGLKSLLTAERARYYLFLGFELDKWYFQLLLSLLELDSDEVVRYATMRQQQVPEPEWSSLFHAHFKFEFVSNDLPAFVAELHRRFAQKNLLRQAANTQPAVRQYNLAAITKLLVNTFDGTQLETFAMCYYTAVYDDFSPEQGKTKRITQLIDYAKRQGQLEQLLALVKDENPVQFAAFAPYTE